MNSRQLEEAYLKEVERISQKVRLGELSHDDGEFLIMLAKEKSRRKMARLKRPSRLIFYLLAGIFAVAFFYCFFQTYKDLELHDLSRTYLIVLGISVGVFIVLFQMELKRVETMFSRFFSKAYFNKVLYAPEIDFEWKKLPMVQLRLEIKNLSNLYAGLEAQEVCELRGNIVATVANTLDDSKAIIEQVTETGFIVDYEIEPEVDALYVLQKVQKLYSELRLMDGQWFAKSVRMGASIVTGEYLGGNMGHRYQVFRTAGNKANIGSSLVEATGWEEVLMDELTFREIDNHIYGDSIEPVFVRNTGSLIKVFKFTGWKEKQGEL